jgi:hypothetical protein
MKRNLIISTTLLAFLLVLTGCSSQTGNNPSGQATGTAPGGRSRQADFGQPQRQADIRGVVKTMVGNEITVLKINMPTTGQRASSTGGTGNAGSTTKNAPAFSLGGDTPGAAPVDRRAAGGPGGGGFGGGDRGGAGGNGQTDRAAMLANLKALSTGEEKVIIPIGIKMLKSEINSSTKKREMVEATLTDITADKTITIWLNTAVTDKKVADFVLIN